MFVHLSIFYGWVRIRDRVEKNWMFVFIQLCIDSYSVFTVKNEFATNENGIHISPKIESVLMNIYMQSSIHG